MAIIPLDKLIEYRGNKFELTKAMIELARNGNSLLGPETKHRGGKYVQTVIKNILDGNIKYAYEETSVMEIDPDAPFLKTDSTSYDSTPFILEVEEPEDEEGSNSSEKAEIELDTENQDDDEVKAEADTEVKEKKTEEE